MDVEQLGAFYLGKEVDVETRTRLAQPLMYDARDLTTHAVCVGMTGSGKTGLCIDLLEEAALDRIPALVIDPKGDITNLLLQFPELRPEDFLPWVNADDAARKNLTLEEFAQQQADLWKNGLSDWGQGPERIRKLSESADFRIYTPGSTSGVPISILDSFRRPVGSWQSQLESILERIQGTVSGLLGLLGVAADPIKSREHILLSNLFEEAWKSGQDLDLQRLILGIQNPPFSRLGVFDVESFFPASERMELALSLNSLIASPSFASWMKGQPLDISSLLFTDDARPRHSIFYIAHLSEPERMFFVTLLLNQMVSWMRTQPGTTSLRALLYMDEIFGFFPPVANPPSKQPMLTLLKQARAFGVGVVLSTQNPVDLDYKGLTNTGTWFIGRLQTERDRSRLLDGLGSSDFRLSGGEWDLDELIGSLDKRVFLMHNIHEPEPVLFQTRWAMSYLRGPLTRDQIRQLTPRDEIATLLSDRGVTGQRHPTGSPVPPPLPVSIPQVFLLPVSGGGASGAEIIYRPHLLGRGEVYFEDSGKGVRKKEEISILTGLDAVTAWEEGHHYNQPVSEAPIPGSLFSEDPLPVANESDLKQAHKDLEDFLYRTRRLTLFYHRTLKVYSEPEETQKDFRIRLEQKAREARDQEIDRIERKYEARLRRLNAQLRKAEIVLQKKSDTASSRKREMLVSVGESILGMFLGRKSIRAASSSLGRYRMSSTAEKAAEEAEEKLESIQEEMAALEAALTEETEMIRQDWLESLQDVEEIEVGPRRTDIDVEQVHLAWAPYFFDPTSGTLGGPAYVEETPPRG